MATPAVPYTADNPFLSVQLGTATALDLSCHLRKVTLDNDHATADIETFCNPGAEKPRPPKWTLSIEALQSFGPDASSNAGLWDTLRPLAGKKVTARYKPDNSTSTATNPQATFDTYVPYITFVDGGIGESTTPGIDFSVLGQPVFTTT